MLSGQRVPSPAQTVAVAAGDVRLTRVLCNYLVEEGTFAQCWVYCRGRDLLRELADGTAPATIVLDEQLLDMSVEEFMAELGALELPVRPAVFVLTRYRYYELSERLSPYGIARCINHLMDPKNLVQAICGWQSTRCAQVPELCGWYYRQWGVQEHVRDCSYLTNAVQLVLNAGEERPLRKQIFADVARRHNVSVAAVDSGIQRLIRVMETEDTAEYRAFLERSGLRAAQFTPTRLVYALAEELRRLPAEGPGQGRAAAAAEREPCAAGAADT